VSGTGDDITGWIATLKKGDLTARHDAEERLRAQGGAAVEPLIEALRREGDGLRTDVEEVLFEIGEPAVEPLIAALSDSREPVRRSAARVLGRFGDRRAVEPLIAALHDEGVRWKAAGVLVKMGSVALEPLQKAVRETADPNIRQGGEWAVKKIQELAARMKERDPHARRSPPRG
jgi:HEAT repeat protein